MSSKKQAIEVIVSLVMGAPPESSASIKRLQSRLAVMMVGIAVSKTVDIFFVACVNCIGVPALIVIVPGVPTDPQLACPVIALAVMASLKVPVGTACNVKVGNDRPL